MLEIIETKQAPAAIGPYSQGVCCGNLLFTAGQTALHPETGEMVGNTVEEQAEQVMKNLMAILREKGVGTGAVIKTTCFLVDMGEFARFNEVYARYFADHKPARSCVAVKALPRGALCEVEAVALLGSNQD